VSILAAGSRLVFSSHTARAASLEPLLQAAGLSAVSPPIAAPDFQLVDVTGALHRLQDQRGKVVFLNFWATWCTPCREEMPLMEQLSQALHQQPFVIWAVNLQESREQVAGFMTGNRLHFPALLDADGTVTTLYKVRGLPTTYLIDCAGNMIGRVMGPWKWTNEATRSLLTAMFEEAGCR
jgi:thiol-disulfide isomerase/thioredoxin